MSEITNSKLDGYVLKIRIKGVRMFFNSRQNGAFPGVGIHIYKHNRYDNKHTYTNANNIVLDNSYYVNY